MTTFNRKALLNALRTVSSVIPTRTPQPILETVLLKCRNGHCSLTATDNECRVSVNIEAGDGDILTLIPSNQVSSLLSAMTDEEVSLSESDGKIVITDQSGKYIIPTTPVGEFPENANPIELTFPTDSVYLSRSLPMVTAVIREKGSGPYCIEGPRFDSIDGKIYIVGTDLNRLCACRLGEGTLEPFTISLKVAGLVAKMQGQVSIGCTNGVASFVSDGMSIITRTVLGTFPKWKPLTDPASMFHKLEVPVSDLLEGLRKTAVFTNEESRGVLLEIGEQSTKLSAAGSGKGQCGIEINGGSLATGTIKLHGELLADFLVKVPQNLSSTLRVGQQFVVEVSDYCRFIMGFMEL